MSVSSATTLISPSTTTTSNKAHPPARRGSHVAHGGHHAAHHSHGPKRRPSTHASHSHNHASFSRRPSDGEHGRRAMTAGLTMHGLDGAHPKPKKRGSGDRPGAKTSRSDTHLPRLSRTTSITSSVSQTSSHSRGKSKGKERKRSTGSVQVLSEDGHDTGEVIETSEDGWESGDAEEEDQEEKKSRGQKKEKRSDQKLADMRRTVSDTQAELPTKSTSTPAIDTGGELVESPLGLEPNHQPPSKQKTTGFAGTIQTPAPDAEMEAQALHNINTPGWNDPTHVMPAHQIRHQKSARSMTTMSAVEPVSGPSSLKPSSGTEGERTPRPGSMMRTGSGKIMQREQVPPATDNDVQVRPNGPTQTRSTGGSGMPKEGIDESPSFPFPKLPSQKASPNIQQPTPPSSTESAAKEATQPSELPRQRKASGTEGAPHRLRHRPSNSSLRSIQSLRAPPHPLNSPTGYRSGLPTYATSRAGSQFNSPQKSERRGPSMHQPPVAPPVVYRETASGQGWDAQRSTDGDPRATGISRTSQDQRAPASVSMTQDSRTRKAADRTSSFSSTRSLQGIMSSTGIGRRVNTGTISPPASVNTPQSRPKAADLAAAAVKMPTTNDPVVYHHSLGYPATSAETAHLISRFLPPKRTKRPEWEITDENASTHSGIGLPKGAYRDAHESLIRMMRDMGNPAPQMARRATNRTVSQHSLLSSGPNGRSNLGLQDAASASNGALTPGVGVGVTRGRNGPLVVARGEGWRGKTPFELSVERCVAQRPTRAMGLGV